MLSSDIPVGLNYLVEGAFLLSTHCFVLLGQLHSNADHHLLDKELAARWYQLATHPQLVRRDSVDPLLPSRFAKL